MGRPKFTDAQKTAMVTVYKITKDYAVARSQLWKTGIRVSLSGLKKVVLRARKRGTVRRPRGSGRIRSSSREEDKLLVRIALRNRQHNLRRLSETLENQTGRHLSTRTVSRRLEEKGLARRPAITRPILNTRQKAKRLSFAESLQHRTIQFWKGVKFSDEKLFSSENFCRRPLVTRKSSKGLDPSCVSRHAKWGIQIHVWGLIGWDGVGPLRIIEGTLTSAKYVDDIIFDISANLVLNQGGRQVRAIFQQDLAPAHSALHTRQFLQSQGVTQLDWPGNSPDLNPIEHVWAHVSRRVRARGRPRNKAELVEWVSAEWDVTPLDFVRGLIRSMNRRLLAVIAQNGDYTHY